MARAEAATAADLAALAAAGRSADPQRACASADEVAAAQAARLVSCTADGLTVDVVVSVPLVGPLAGLPDLSGPGAGRPARSTVSNRAAPALSSGSFPLPHLGDCTHDGQPDGHSHVSSTLERGGEPLGGPLEAPLARTPRRRGARRRRTRWPARCPGGPRWRPRPTSHRSQVATRGRSPMAACSAACTAPGTSTAAARAAASCPSVTVHQTAVVRSVRAGRSRGSSPSTSPVPSRRRRKPTTWLVTSTSPSMSRAAPHACDVRSASTRRSVTSRAEVVQSGVAGVTSATASSRSRPSTR